MATAKKKTAPKKKSPSAKTTAPKPSATTRAKASTIPGSREAKLAEQALGFIDEAASVLREAVHSGADTTARARIAAKKRANTLIGKASNNLTKAIGDGSSVLSSLIGKL